MSARPPASSHTIAAICISKLLESARVAGVDTRGLPGIDHCPGEPGLSIDPFEKRVPHTVVLDLWEAIMARSPDRGFPIFCATRVRLSDYDTIGFACMTRATLREALHQCVRYARIWADMSAWEVTERDGVVTATFTSGDTERVGSRYVAESVIAEIIHGGRLLTGVDYTPREVLFRHPKPADTRGHEAFFRSELRFDAGRNAIVLDAAVLDTPLLKADADLAAFFERHADALMARCAREPGLTDRLRRAIADELRRGLPTLEAIAAQLAQSPRTLRRRLQEEGTSFQEVLDETRRELALRYLEEERIPLGEVAFLLGFSEASAFHRAFKRWTGETPASYRKKGLSAA